MVLKFTSPLAKMVAKVKAPYTYIKPDVKAISLGLNLKNLDGDILQIQKIKGTNINAITSDYEFGQVLKKLKQHRSWAKDWDIPNANQYETALMPYTGHNDICSEINEYLRTGKLSDYSYTLSDGSILRDYIRAMDYSLKNMDNMYGQFKGIVYRFGRMGNKTTSYVSTAKNPLGAIFHAGPFGLHRKPFNIIFTEHGHKIEEMQKKLSYSKAYIKESEILLDPGKEYQQISELTPELNAIKQQLFNTIKKEHGINPEGLVDVHFWREIL